MIPRTPLTRHSAAHLSPKYMRIGDRVIRSLSLYSAAGAKLMSKLLFIIALKIKDILLRISLCEFTYMLSDGYLKQKKNHRYYYFVALPLFHKDLGKIWSTAWEIECWCNHDDSFGCIWFHTVKHLQLFVLIKHFNKACGQYLGIQTVCNLETEVSSLIWEILQQLYT